MLHIDRLSANYGLFQALFDIDLHVDRGEAVALIGANGAGKSTLFKAIAGAIAVRHDAVRIDGTPVGGAPEIAQLRRGVALVPEGRRLFPSLSVLENLALASRKGRAGQWTVAKLLEEIPSLGRLRHRPSTALSGGQQQLVAIARALVTNPRYLLCDEISLGLSPIAVEEVYTLLRRVKQSGVAILLVEQNMARALSESARFYCLQKGRVALGGDSARADRKEVSHAYLGV